MRDKYILSPVASLSQKSDYYIVVNTYFWLQKKQFWEVGFLSLLSAGTDIYPKNPTSLVCFST